MIYDKYDLMRMIKAIAHVGPHIYKQKEGKWFGGDAKKTHTTGELWRCGVAIHQTNTSRQKETSL